MEIGDIIPVVMIALLILAVVAIGCFFIWIYWWAFTTVVVWLVTNVGWTISWWELLALFLLFSGLAGVGFKSFGVITAKIKERD